MIKEKDLDFIENKIGYHFNNRNLLQQAFTRRSYVAMVNGNDNEILEFFGDRVLALAIMLDFQSNYTHISLSNEFECTRSLGDLNKIYGKLAKNKKLSNCISAMGLNKYLQVGLRLERDTMKNKADLFEAILAAVAFDSDWDLYAIEDVFQNLISWDNHADNECRENLILPFCKQIADRHLPFPVYNYEYQPNNIICFFTIHYEEREFLIKGYGQSELIAKEDACEEGYNLLRLIADHKFIEGISFEKQLKILEKYHYFTNLDYRFELFPRKNCNEKDVWKCYLTCAECDSEFCSESNDMEDALDLASHAFLCEMLGIEYEEESEEDGVVRGQGLLKYILSKYGKLLEVA